jgi:hypothetical protein
MNVEVAKNAGDDWYSPYIDYAKELEIIDPDTTSLDPAGKMSRGEVAYAIWRLMEIEY